MNVINLESVAPVPAEGHTSKGNQPKWLHDGLWYKADYMGHEALSEVVLSRLLEKSNIPDFLRYDPIHIEYHGELLPGCVSRNFRGLSETIIPFERLHRAYEGIGLAENLAHMELTEQVRYTVDFVERVTGLSGVGVYLTQILEWDAFTLNEDRHTNNFAVIRDEVTKKFRLCPFFDNGLSLLSDWHDYPLDSDIYRCIAKVRAKPFDRDFDKQVEAAEQLYKPQLRLFFTEKDIQHALSELQSLYQPAILNRAERILLEQKRKYQIFF